MCSLFLPNIYSIFIWWKPNNIKPAEVLNKNKSATIQFVILNEANLFNTKIIFPTQKKKKKWKEDKKSEKCSEYTKLEFIIVKGLWLLCDYEVHRGEIENFLTLFKQ